MGQNIETVDMWGLKFFGEISASISHDIKNELSVINENAGLLQDYTRMAEKGHPLDLKRVQRVAMKMQERVRRADTIVQNLNKFSHTIDHPLIKVDISEALSLLTSLTDRLTSAKNHLIRIINPKEPAVVRTSPFLLINLLWICLKAVMNHSETNVPIQIQIRNTQSSFRVCFEGAGDLESVSTEFADGDTTDLISTLKAEVFCNIETGQLELILPVSLP